MVTALVLHGGDALCVATVSTPRCPCDYWNCTGVPALGCLWLPVLLAALLEGGGSALFHYTFSFSFSFLLLGLCLGPVLGSRFGPKSGVSHRRILLLPAEVLQADLRRTSMSVSVNTCFFSLCVPLCFLYSRGPFLAAMFLLVFWILFWEP